MSHIPVLLNETRDLLKSVKIPVRVALDGTFGRGGHTKMMLETFPDATVYAFDQDNEAIAHGKATFAKEIEQGRLKLTHANFANFMSAVPGKIDVGLLDLGVSSPQLDQAERGFSFYGEGPLDMRMDQSALLTAAQVLQETDEKELLSIFSELGEVERPQRVVRAIVHDRKTKPFVQTKELASLIERVDGWKKKGVHPATQYFLALRIYVNRELEILNSIIPSLISALNDGGILAVISFHSLEDRIIKQAFRDAPDTGIAYPKRVIAPSEKEIKANPRSRSAKLRGFLRELPMPKNKYIQFSKIKGPADAAEEKK